MTFGIGGGGFDVQLARMMAEQQIASERVGLELVHGTHDAAQAELQVKHTAKENANDLASVMATVNIVMSAVKVGQAAQNLGQTADATANLKAGMDDPKTASGDLTALKNSEMMGGGKVGDRFTDSQLKVLSGLEDVRGLSDAQLLDRGFTQKEVTWLRAYGSDGLSHDEGVTFIMQHGAAEHGFSARQMDAINGAAGTAGAQKALPTDEALKQQGFSDSQIRGLHDLHEGRITQREFMSEHGGQKVDVKAMIKEGFMNILSQIPDKMVEVANKDAETQGKRSDEAKGILDETAGALRDNISEFKKDLLELELKKIEGQSGQNTHASTGK